MEDQRLLSYLTSRLSLLEAWQKLYAEYEPGDPELSDGIEVCLEQINALDQSENPEWNKMEIIGDCRVAEKRSMNRQALEMIYNLHQNHLLNLKNHKETLILDMKGVRKAKVLSGQILSTSNDRVSRLDTTV